MNGAEPIISPHLDNVRRLAIPWDRVKHELIAGNPLPPELAVYMHIPKTGGQSLQSMLGMNYRPHQIFHVPGDTAAYANWLEAAPDSVRQRHKIIIGHLKFRERIYGLIDQPFYFFTMLRDPVKRVVSMYHFIRNSEWHAQHALLRDEGISLVDYVSDRKRFGNQNLMTNYLSGSRVLNEDALRLAFQNLQQCFTFFGLTDRYDELVTLIQQALAIPNRFYVRTNTGQRSAREHDERELAAVAAAVPLDMALYQAAVKLYDDRFARMGTGFSQRVAQFQRMNRRFHDIDRDASGHPAVEVSEASPVSESERPV